MVSRFPGDVHGGLRGAETRRQRKVA